MTDQQIHSPLDEIGDLYRMLRVIAATEDHPFRGRAEHAAAVLKPVLETAGHKPVEPRTDPVFGGPEESAVPVSVLDRRFERLFGFLCHVDGMLSYAHAVNAAWVELDLSDGDAFPLPDRTDRRGVFPVSGMERR